MTDAQRRQAAKSFAEKWKGRGYEKGESLKCNAKRNKICTAGI